MIILTPKGTQGRVVHEMQRDGVALVDVAVRGIIAERDVPLRSCTVMLSQFFILDDEQVEVEPRQTVANFVPVPVHREGAK